MYIHVTRLLFCFLFTALSFPVTADPDKLTGYWNSRGGQNIFKIQKIGSASLEGRLLKVTDSAFKLGYQENDLVIKNMTLIGQQITFETAIRTNDPEKKNICDVAYLPFSGAISNDFQQITGKRQAGKFEVTKGADGELIDCQFVSTQGAVDLAYVRNKEFEPVIKVITVNGSESLAIGDIFLVQIELKEESTERQVNAKVKVGEKTINIVADRVSEFPAVYESDLMEVTWRTGDSPWADVDANYMDFTHQVTVDGWTPDALIHLISRLLEQAISEKDSFSSFYIAERIYELAKNTKSPPIWRFAGLGLQGVASHTALPEMYEDFADRLLGLYKSDANIKLRTHLDNIYPDIKSDNEDLRRGFALLKEAAFINALKKLVELNRVKKGSGLVSNQSYLALSGKDALSQLRTMTSGQLDAFLKMEGVSNNKSARKTLRNDLSSTSKSKYAALATAAEHLEFSKNAMGVHGIYDSLSYFDYDNDRLPDSLRNFRKNIIKYQNIVAIRPLLNVKVKDERSAMGSKAPLWRVLGRPDSNRTDKQDQMYIDRALKNSENALKDVLRRVVAMEDESDYLELGGPKYKTLQDMAGNNFGASYAYSLVDFVKGKYVEDNASDYLWELVWDDVLTIVQVGGTLYPPVAVAASTVKIIKKGNETHAAYKELTGAETTSDAGFGSHDSVLSAQDQLKSKIGDLSFEVVFAGLDVAMMIEWSAMRALRALKAAAQTSAEGTKEVIKQTGKKIEQELAANQRFLDDVANRKRLTIRHRKLANKTREDLFNIQDDINKFNASGAADEVTKLRNKKAKRSSTLQHHLRNLASSEKKLAGLLKDGPKLPSLGGRTRYMKQGQDVERGATIAFFESVMARYPDVVKRTPQGGFKFGGIEFRFKKKIVDESGNLLHQKPTVNIYEEVNGQLVKKGTEANPHAGKTMEFDRVIIDHNTKTIYLEDIVRSPDARHLKKTFGYYEGLKTMFKKKLTEESYSLALPKDVHFGKMQTPFNAVAPSGAKYKVANGKSYID